MGAGPIEQLVWLAGAVLAMLAVMWLAGLVLLVPIWVWIALAVAVLLVLVSRAIARLPAPRTPPPTMLIVFSYCDQCGSEMFSPHGVCETCGADQGNPR